MRSGATGGWTALAVAAAVCAAAPARAATLPAQAVLEPSFGALLPFEGWVLDRPADDRDGTRAVTFGDLLAPAFAANLAFAYLFPVGGDGPCCRLGPEFDLSWVYWNADDPSSEDTDWRSGDLQGGLLRVLVGMRLLVDYEWGYVVGRLALGPEIAAGREDEFDEVESDVGTAILAGGGVGFRLADFLGISLLASFVATFHEDEDERYDWYFEDIYFTYDSLGVDLSVAATWFF